MFTFVAVVALLAVTSSSAQEYNSDVVGVRIHDDQRYADDYNEPHPYQFRYDIKDDYNGQNYRQESGDGYGNVKGSYGYTDAYGIYRQVEYTADENGFRVDSIKTNEPGTANQNPAHVNIYAEPAPVQYQQATRNREGYAPQRQHGAAAPQRQQNQRADSHPAPGYQQRTSSYRPQSDNKQRSVSYSAPAHQRQTGSYAPQRDTSYKAAPAHQQRATSYKAAPAHQQRATSYNSAPAHQQRATSYKAAPVHQERATSYNAAPVHQERATSYNSAPAHQERATSYNAAPVHQQRATSYKAAPVHHQRTQKKAVIYAAPDQSERQDGYARVAPLPSYGKERDYQ